MKCFLTVGKSVRSFVFLKLSKIQGDVRGLSVHTEANARKMERHFLQGQWSDRRRDNSFKLKVGLGEMSGRNHLL